MLSGEKISYKRFTMTSFLKPQKKAKQNSSLFSDKYLYGNIIKIEEKD